MTTSSPLTLSELQMLAPVHLPSSRQGRYQGEEERVRLDFFSLEDRVLLQRIYRSLLALFEELKPCHSDRAQCLQILEKFVANPEYRRLGDEVAELGHATRRERPGAEVDRTVHDLRGGALQALLFRLQLFALAPQKPKGVQNIYFLLRDHLKIMRNCTEDLDPVLFHADSLSLAHDVQLLVEKWSQADFHAIEEPVRVDLTCFFEGTLCESCLEFSSLDRIIYNLMNNAAAYTADGLVHFYVLPVPFTGASAENVRFVVVNKVTEEHREILEAQFGDNIDELFAGGFTTGGHGFGTRICADFCAHAYGIFDFEAARRAGYFGARWIGGSIAIWFHWPVVGS